MLDRAKRASHIDPPASSYAIMQRACPYCGENPGPGKDVYGELDPRPGIREQPRHNTDIGVRPLSHVNRRAHAQLQSITKMQIQTIDQMMDIWEEQIKSPNPMSAPSAMLSKLKSLPGGPAGCWPNADVLAGPEINPMHFWGQWAEQCKKAWADAVGVAIGGQHRR